MTAHPPDPAGSLTIVGLGPGRPEHITVEARAHLSNLSARAVVLGFSRDAAHVAACNPHLRLTSLETFYEDLSRSRAQVIEAIIRHILQLAFREQREVTYVTAGNPVIINDLVLHLRRTCARYHKPIRIVPGLSFLEVILTQVSWDAEEGLQLHSAWSVARGGAPLNPTVPALLYELGEGAPGATMDMLAGLREALSLSYPPTHEVTLLSSSESPRFEPTSRSFSLAELPGIAIPELANLWVPRRRVS